MANKCIGQILEKLNNSLNETPRCSDDEIPCSFENTNNDIPDAFNDGHDAIPHCVIIFLKLFPIARKNVINHRNDAANDLNESAHNLHNSTNGLNNACKETTESFNETTYECYEYANRDHKQSTNSMC